ncbi:alpha/beta hydrolase family protein [Prescottella subtropica]|uniref:alpha/beta hydrolase family protein n=1 Tax=Prescottella subtropica TaxID=2545757 RepID=UPI0010F90D04|nr:lipase family protein [Prescottella subtropica]
MRARLRAAAVLVTALTDLTALAAVLLAVPATASPPAPAGTLLDRSALAPATVPAAAGDSARIRYATLRTATAAGESTGSVFLPHGTPPDGGWPVVSYAHGTVGVADQCAPSTAGFNYVERPAIEAWLTAGYAVVATDYAGIGTDGVNAYLDGPAAGANAVDIVTAAHQAYDGVLSDRWIVTGLSQGGHATYFAAAEATGRAPGLDYRGAVAIGAPTHLENLFPLAGPAFPPVATSGLVNFALFTLAGVDDQRPEVDIRRYLTPVGIDLMERAKITCSVELGQYLREHPVTLGELFTTTLWNDEVRGVLHRMLTAPTTGFDRPLRVVHSLADTTVPIPLTWAQLSEMTANGVDYRYQQLVAESHTESLMAAMPASRDFAGRVLG